MEESWFAVRDDQATGGAGTRRVNRPQALELLAEAEQDRDEDNGVIELPAESSPQDSSPAASTPSSSSSHQGAPISALTASGSTDENLRAS